MLSFSIVLASIDSGAALVVSALVAKWAPPLVRQYLTDQVIERAVHYALGRIEGAAAGKELDLKTSNEVLAAAEQYTVTLAPKVAVWLGDKLKPLLLAKLSALGSAPTAAVNLPAAK